MTQKQWIGRAVLVSLIWIPVYVQASVVQIGTDNDVIFQSDGDYTGGLFAGYSSTPQPKNPDSHWLVMPDASFNWSLQLRQQLWTPSEIRFQTPKTNERPYAGALTLSLAGTTFSASESVRLGARVGVLGPSSGAESVQKTTHKWFGSTQPAGWDYQVKNQAIVDVSAEYDRLFFRSSSNHEVSGFGRIVAGNFQPEIAGGLGWRWGSGLDASFNASSLRPFRQDPLSRIAQKNYWYVYSSLEARYQLRDLTVTGETLKPVPKVTLQRARGTAALGIVWGYQQVGMAFSVMANTKSFEEDRGTVHLMGALSLFRRF